MNEDVAHGDDLSPRDAWHAVTSCIGDVSSGLADLLNGVPDGAEEHGI